MSVPGRLLSLSILMLLACDGNGPSGTSEGSRLLVIVSTEGAFLDPDGYQLTLDGAPIGSVGQDERRTLTDLAPGEHQIGVLGLAPGCGLADENPRAVTASPEVIGEVRFEVLCGSVIFASDRGANRELYRMRLDGSTDLERLTEDPGTDFEPAILSNGQSIAFTSTWSGGSFEVFRRGIDAPEVLQLTMGGGRSASWAPDGARVAFETFRDGNTEIYVTNADGSMPVNLTMSPGSDDEAEWSPDGTHIVFASTRDGPRAIYVMEADGSNPRRLSPADGGYPTWSADGQRIAYVEGQDRTTIVIIRPDGTGLVRIELLIRAFQLSWQPGTQILFASEDTGQIHRLDVEDAVPIALTDHPTLDVTPAWGP